MKRCRKDLHDFEGNQCEECKAAGKKVWNLANHTKVVEKTRQWRKDNPRRASINKIQRRLAKQQRTPKWLSNEEKELIKQFYLNCPAGYEVDHIIPLQGKKVSGLHMLANLQYLTTEDNKRKGNRYETTN
jgi:5-methylcytosine-specific restriction endonuclease McrA